MNKLITMALPSNPRAKEDSFPILEQSLKLERSGPGKYRSPYLANTNIVEIKQKDIVRLMREKVIDIGVFGDDVGSENLSMFASDSRPCNSSPYEYFALRTCRMKIEKPAQLRYLAREEDALKFDEDFYFGNKKPYVNLPDEDLRSAVTSYPGNLRSSLGELGFAPYGGAVRTKDYNYAFNIKPVDGQVESYMRNGVYPNTIFAFDLVRSGKTAKNFGLVPVNKPVLTVYPSIWSGGNIGAKKTDPYREEVLAEIKERLGKNIPLID